MNRTTTVAVSSALAVGLMVGGAGPAMAGYRSCDLGTRVCYTTHDAVVEDETVRSAYQMTGTLSLFSYNKVEGTRTRVTFNTIQAQVGWRLTAGSVTAGWDLQRSISVDGVATVTVGSGWTGTQGGTTRSVSGNALRMTTTGTTLPTDYAVYDPQVVVDTPTTIRGLTYAATSRALLPDGSFTLTLTDQINLP